MEYQNFLSYVIIVIIWSSMAILSIIVYFLFPPEITFWDKIYDKCSPNEAKYRYVVRIMSADMKKGFDPTRTTMTLDIIYQFDKKLSLTVTPKMLSTRIMTSTRKYKYSRFLLYRKEPLKDILKVQLNHNGVGAIVVPTVEIQDINSPKANIAYFGKEIVKCDKEKASAHQTEPAATQDDRPIEPGIRVTTSLTALEFIIFFFMAINLMIFLTIYVIPCTEEGFCQDYNRGFSSAVFSGVTASLISAIVFAIGCATHRYIIKKSIVKGIEFCSAIRYLFLFTMTVSGAVFGLISAVMAAQNRRFPAKNPKNEFFHEVYWLFAVGIAITVFFLFWISLFALIAFLIGFFSDDLAKTVDSTVGATIRTNSNDTDENDKAYMDVLSKTAKVKSISQYKGINKGSVPSSTAASTATKNSTATSKSSPKVTTKTEEEDSGDNYYQQLMKEKGKVKSISQYGGTK